MANAQCAQCGHPKDSRSLTLCPVCRGSFCEACLPRHRMQCGCEAAAQMAVEPI